MNDGQKFGAVLEALELIAHTIAHNAVVEQIYVNCGLLASGLRDALVKLYTRVLQCLIEANHYYGKSNLSTLFRRSHPPLFLRKLLLRAYLGRLVGSIVEFPGSFQKFVDDIKAAQLDVDAAARLIDADSRLTLNSLCSWRYSG